MFSETFISIVRRQPWRIRANWGERRLYMKKTAAPHGYFNRIYASGKWHRSPCDPNTYFSAMWNIQRQRTHRVASILLCFLHITPSTNTAVALVVNQEVIVYLPGEAAIHPQLSTWCLDPKSPPPEHPQTWKHEWREISNSLYRRYYGYRFKILEVLIQRTKRITLWRAFLLSCVNIKYTRRVQI